MKSIKLTTLCLGLIMCNGLMATGKVTLNNNLSSKQISLGFYPLNGTFEDPIIIDPGMSESREAAQLGQIIIRQLENNKTKYIAGYTFDTATKEKAWTFNCNNSDIQATYDGSSAATTIKWENPDTVNFK